ncbi:MAG: hypothetical protein ACR2FN_00235 [Chitinophagaceae bacterium]
MKKIFLLLIISLITFFANAQFKNHAYFIPQVALQNGADKVSWQMQFIGGYKIKSWNVGAGAAIDYYKFRTVPVFVDVRESFTKKLNGLFAYLNAGFNAEWILDNQHYNNNNYYSNYLRTNNGWYSDVGVGYKLFAKNNKGLLLSAGFTTKTLSQVYNEYVFVGVDAVQLLPHKYDYMLNRLAIKIGYEF